MFLIGLLDPKNPELRQATIEAFTGSIPSLVESMAESFPDQKTRTEFAEKVVAEMKNPNYHLYTTMYNTSSV